MIKCFGFLISSKLEDAGFWNLSLADVLGFFAKSEPQKHIWIYLWGFYLKKKKEVCGTLGLGKKLFKACERLGNFERECANTGGMGKVTEGSHQPQQVHVGVGTHTLPGSIYAYGYVCEIIDVYPFVYKR